MSRPLGFVKCQSLNSTPYLNTSSTVHVCKCGCLMKSVLGTFHCCTDLPLFSPEEKSFITHMACLLIQRTNKQVQPSISLQAMICQVAYGTRHAKFPNMLSLSQQAGGCQDATWPMDHSLQNLTEVRDGLQDKMGACSALRISHQCWRMPFGMQTVPYLNGSKVRTLPSQCHELSLPPERLSGSPCSS